MTRLGRLFKTTAVRLTIIYTLLFGVLAAGVVAYISYNTGTLLIGQFKVTIDEEVQEIASIIQRGGVRRLIPLVERRARRPGANLYLIADPSGNIIAGNVRKMAPELIATEGWRDTPFLYDRFDNDGAKSHRAIARVFALPGDLRLLVGRDIGEAERFRSIVRRASVVSLAVMLLTGVVLWLLVGRRALRHIDQVSESSSRIMAGDLSQRLPISGANDEFDRLSSNLNRIIGRVEKLNSGMRIMSDSIAHDLRTPLTRLRNRAEAVSGMRKATDRNAELDHIVEDADGLIRTFDALLMITQVESGARAVQFEAIKLGPILQDVYELFEPSAEEAGVKLDMKIEDDALVAKSNRELIAQALTNLIDNALKYGVSNKNPLITLHLSRIGARAMIGVSDNGLGIDVDAREKVVERFVRLDESRNLNGSGLGLALVDAVAKLHDGELILADNNPGLKIQLAVPLAN